MSIVIYYLDGADLGCFQYEDADFDLALKRVQLLRAEGMSHVSMSNEPANMVGTMGVDEVKDGKTPDGHDYEWSKQHRGAGPKEV